MHLSLPRSLPLALGAAAWVVAAAAASAAAGLLVAAEPTAAFDAALVGVCAALIAWRPYAALLLLLLVRGGVATSPGGALIHLLVLASGGIAVLACARRLEGWRVMLPFGAFVLLALPLVPPYPSWDEGAKSQFLRLPLVQEEYLRTPSNEMFELLRLAAGLVAFAWAAWAVRTRQRLDAVMAVVIAGASYPVVDGLIELATGQTRVRSSGGFESVVGPFSHPNGFASFLVIVSTLALVAIFETRHLWLRVGLGLFLGGSLTCLLFTYTRAAWVGFAVAVLLLGVLRYRRLFLIGTVAVVLAAVAAPETTRRAEQRFNDLSADSQIHSRNSWSWRTNQWEKMIPFGLERPVFGRGFGSYARNTVTVFGTRDREYSTLPDRHRGVYGFGAHNDYVKSLVETGVVGLCLWVLTLAGVLSIAVRARRLPELAAWGTGVLGVGVAMIIISFADNIQAAYVDTLYLFALVGALAGAAGGVRAARARAEAPGAGAAILAGTQPAEPPAAPEQPGTESPSAAEAADAPERERPPAVALQSLRTRVGGWLRRRGR